MKPLSIFLALSSTLFLAACANPPLSGAGAAPQPKVDEHAAHQAAAAATPASPAASSHMQHPMQDHMKSMQAMREKMMAAKTPAERQHMLEMRMDMMETMMQRMHGNTAAPAAR